jgi:replicative DNA helicase
MTTTVTFGDDFKDKALALNLRDRNFCERVDGLIKPEFFESEVDKYILSLIHNHYKKYRINPSPVALSQTFKEDKAKGLLRKELEGPVTTKIKDLYKADISDREFIIERVAEFVRRQATEMAVMEAADIVDNGGNLDNILPIFQKAIDVGTSDLSSAYDYNDGDSIRQRSAIRKARLAGEISYNSVTTGFKEFDETLYRKGWGKGELSILMAPSKRGKSIGLLDHALRAAEKGNKVLFVSLEVSTEIQVDRMDANISGVKMDNLNIEIDKVEERVAKWTGRAATLKLHEYPSGTFSVSQLRRLVKKYQALGIQFDLVVVDYMDIMLSENNGDGIEKSKQVAIDLRALAQTENFAILTATQTNRSGADVDTVTMTHVADDFNKIRTADLVITINVNEIEQETGEARLYYAASRNQKPVTIFVKRDLSVMKHIKEITDIKG